MEFDAAKVLQELLLRFSSFGQEPGGGISRTFGSPVYQQAAQALEAELKSLGLRSWIDPVGNVHGVLAGIGPAPRRELLVGSHLDTVREGGRFDGLLGVLAPVVCCQRLAAEGKALPFDLHLIATNGEEGNELGGTFGSRCLTGLFDPQAPGMPEKLARYHLTPEGVRASAMDFSRALGWLELHIEQGPTLEETGDQIGIVTGIVGLQRYAIEVRGESNHAGTTMMNYRKDALVGAAELICNGDRLARQLGQELVCTFSNLSVHPNVTAVINDRIQLLLECRNRDQGLMEQFVSQLRDTFQPKPGVTVTFENTVKKAPVDCDPHLTNCSEAACLQLGLRYRTMPSGATHDGNMFARKVPIGMIFVPSRGGISHSKEEWTDWDSCGQGLEVLYQTILQLEGNP